MTQNHRNREVGGARVVHCHSQTNPRLHFSTTALNAA